MDVQHISRNEVAAPGPDTDASHGMGTCGNSDLEGFVRADDSLPQRDRRLAGERDELRERDAQRLASRDEVVPVSGQAHTSGRAPKSAEIAGPTCGGHGEGG